MGTYIDEGLGFPPAQRAEGSLPSRLLEGLEILLPVECDEPLLHGLVSQFWRGFNPHRIRSTVRNGRGKKKRKKRR